MNIYDQLSELHDVLKEESHKCGTCDDIVKESESIVIYHNDVDGYLRLCEVCCERSLEETTELIRTKEAAMCPSF